MCSPNDGASHQPTAMLNHNLRNKLAAIVGHCYLLGLEAPPGSVSSKRLGQIHDLAFQISEMMERQSQSAPEAALVASHELQNLPASS
jgi:hypothetical protein